MDHFGNDEHDGNVPTQDATLGDWRFFVLRLFSDESPAFRYIDQLCKDFGVEWRITLTPMDFFMHIALFNNSAVLDTERFARGMKMMEEGK